MRRPSWATRPVLIAALAAALVLAGTAVFLGRDNSDPGHGSVAGPGSDAAATIPVAGGARLTAEVITPAGSGPFPLVVMPASWNAEASEYTVAGRGLAAAGYQVVAYAQRGSQSSTGSNDFAGSATRADARAVVDWALAHTRADRSRIGMLGISYGAGISLLAAASDPRIRAVVAMSGWTDLQSALAANGTPDTASLHSLLDSRSAAGALAAPTRQLAQSLSGDAAGISAVLGALSAGRSPLAEVPALNRNRTAIMLANAYGDSVLDPSDVVPFFERLTTAKRLQLAPGDHGGPELAGLYGKPDRTFADATAWLDHYLRGRANGIEAADPVQLQDGATGGWHGFRSWPAARTTVQLGAPNTAGDVVLGGAPPWSATLTTGTDSGASSGPFFTLQPNPYRPPSLPIGTLDRSRSLSWTGDPLAAPVTVSGSPTVRLTVGSSSPRTTFFLHLYDVDPTGTATLMTFAPETAPAGTVQVTLRPVSWTVAAGHHMALVIDTVDSRYVSAAPSGSTLTLSGSSAAPAQLSL